MKVERLDDRQTVARSAACIYAGAFLVGLIEGFIPGGSQLSNWPGVGALGMAVFSYFAGPRLPRRSLALLGPVGCALIAWAVVETNGQGDGAVLYTWPALWMAYFFGRRGAVVTVITTGVFQGVALLAINSANNSADRIVDVVAAVAVVSAVTCFLSERNRELVGRLTAEARIDPLTGLLNRRGLQERMEVEQSRALRDGTGLAVVTFDLDHFKRVNDEHGHEVGDRALAWVASLLAREVRGSDAAARSGGEEFVVLLPGTTERQAMDLAERVRHKVEQRERGWYRADHGLPEDLRLTVSAGVAASTSADGEAVLLAADRALYAAKRDGRNRTVAASAQPAGEPEFA